MARGDNYGKCKVCGAEAEWADYYDEEGCGPFHEPSDHCGRCTDIIIERTNQRREWDYYHPGERCPEIELTPLPGAAKQES